MFDDIGQAFEGHFGVDQPARRGSRPVVRQRQQRVEVLSLAVQVLEQIDRETFRFLARQKFQ